MDGIEKRPAVKALIEKGKAAGKLTVRERITACTDPDSFTEVGSLTGSGQYDSLGRLVEFTPSNLVMGRARIGGRPVVVVGDDFTVRGGASDEAIASAIAPIWQQRTDRYSELRSTLPADNTQGARRVEMSYIGG